MVMHYLDEDETRHWVQPTIEVFRIPEDYPVLETEDGAMMGPGWYFWFTDPGRVPVSYPRGPFECEDDALAEARSHEGDSGYEREGEVQ